MATICVFLASASPGDEYLTAARALGGAIARAGHTLVYGGASIGLMGALADGALAGGGRVIGVIPSLLVDRELAHAGLSALEIVDDMHRRQARMAALADGFIVAPGGYGTLAEAFEILTARQLRHHGKPIVFFDPIPATSYWAPLGAFLDHAVGQGALRGELRALFQIVSGVDEAVAVAGAIPPRDTLTA